MSNDNINILEMLQDSLPDLASTEIKVLQAVAAQQRAKNPARAGLVKFWSALFLLLDLEDRRRKGALQRAEMDYHDIQDPIIEWTGKTDPENSVNLQVIFPEHVKENDNGGDENGPDKNE